MTTLTMPVISEVTPRFDLDAEARLVPTTPLQRALYKYMRPLDRETNIYVLSNDAVVTDLPVLLSNGSYSSTAVPYPITSYGAITPGTIIGPPEGAEGGPFGPPPPFSVVQDNITDSVHGGTYTEFTLDPYLVYIFLGGHGPYAGLSENLVTILTNAHFDNYLS